MAVVVEQEYVPAVEIKRLRPHPRNARRGDMDAIRESIRANGFYGSAVVQKSTGLVVAGWHRSQAAADEGLTTVPVTYAELSDAEALRIVLADNATSDRATYDPAALMDALEAMPDFEGTGWTPGRLEQMLAATKPPANREKPPEVESPPAPESPTSETGVVYELGKHRLICADAHDPDALAELFGSRRKADAVVTDPPYAIYGSSTGISSEITDDRLVVPSFRAILQLAEKHLPEYAQAYVSCDWRSWPAWWEAARQTRMVPKNLLVWDKGGSGLGSNWAMTHEFVAYFIHLPPVRALVNGRKGGIKPVLAPNLLRFPRVAGAEREHNAAKPVAMLEHILEVTPLRKSRGALVLDPFAGSGSTLLAADRLGHVAYLVEIEPAMCDVIRARYARHADRPDLAP